MARLVLWSSRRRRRRFAGKGSASSPSGTPSVVYSGGAMAPSVSLDDFERSMRAAAERQASEGLAKHPDLVAELVIKEGNPAQVLLDESAGADMLVLGSRGLGGFRGLLLGSIGQQCVHHSRCPVVIVPPPDDRREPT